MFAQLKGLLDAVERDLFSKHMPSVSYLRLDGNVEPQVRDLNNLSVNEYLGLVLTITLIRSHS